MRNLQEHVKKAFCYQIFFWPFTVWINCHFANSWPSASNLKSFSRSLQQFFLTVVQNNFGNKISNISSILITVYQQSVWEQRLGLLIWIDFFEIWTILKSRLQILFSGWLCRGLNMGRIIGFYILGDFLVLIFHYLKCEESWITKFKLNFLSKR